MLVVVANSSDVLVLTEQDCGKSFAFGPRIEIRLNALPSAGYDWYFVNIPKHIKAERHYAKELSKKGSSIVGSQIERRFLINTSDVVGGIILAMEYKRSWEEEVMKRCTFNLSQKHTKAE